MNDRSVRQIPAHLRKYVASQNYSDYSPIDHEVWRYVMRRNIHSLASAAHPAYVPGLRASGIHLDRIPDVNEMNANLSKLGFGAVVVDGLIPSVAFFDFMAHGLLPISVDIRSLDHIEYTPAPDIIHEAAGHAPILYDQAYAEYVKVFGEIGAKAFGTKEEHDVFDAVRNLTIVMENPASTEQEIEAAGRVLEEKQKVPRTESEETRLSRLFWWTVEYGLVGTLEKPVIYGAGLLSSVKEGGDCLKDSVQKLPFDLDACIQTDYDVTKPQPQLFVCDNFGQLISAAQDLSKSMAFQVGGTESLEKALASGRVATAVYSSGLQVSGMVSEVLKDESDTAVYLKTSGPSALAVNNQELKGHGSTYHAHGFGSPIGHLQGTSKPLEDFTDEDLEAMDIVVGKGVPLSFESGIIVGGIVKSVHRAGGKVVTISFEDCTVVYGNQVLFRPDWGTYDMAVGAAITSAFPGAADKDAYESDVPDSMSMSPVVSVKNPTRLEKLYSRVRELRVHVMADEGFAAAARSIYGTLKQEFPLDWLLRLHLLEITLQRNVEEELCRQLEMDLHQQAIDHPKLHELIEHGLAMRHLSMNELAKTS